MTVKESPNVDDEDVDLDFPRVDDEHSIVLVEGESKARPNVVAFTLGPESEKKNGRNSDKDRPGSPASDPLPPSSRRWVFGSRPSSPDTQCASPSRGDQDPRSLSFTASFLGARQYVRGGGQGPGSSRPSDARDATSPTSRDGYPETPPSSFFRRRGRTLHRMIRTATKDTVNEGDEGSPWAKRGGRRGRDRAPSPVRDGGRRGREMRRVKTETSVSSVASQLDDDRSSGARTSPSIGRKSSNRYASEPEESESDNGSIARSQAPPLELKSPMSVSPSLEFSSVNSKSRDDWANNASVDADFAVNEQSFSQRDLVQDSDGGEQPKSIFGFLRIPASRGPGKDGRLDRGSRLKARADSHSVRSVRSLFPLRSERIADPRGEQNGNEGDSPSVKSIRNLFGSAKGKEGGAVRVPAR